MPEITELFNIDWRETSFVGQGDNPEARVVMWKSKPDLTDAEIEEVLDEVANEGRPQVAEVDTLAQQKVEAEPERFGKIADPANRLAAARAEVRAERADLRDQESALAAQEPATVQEPVKKGAQEYAELHRVAKAELPELYRKSPGAAVTKISESRPDLREAWEQAARS